ncbi:50S ribosomal protein L14 [Candidatus Woesearchaeota archaeon CG08_land_8_20_14_0_20_47_9]|nr:MAG: 50S ribosomal protein L14 [Candidatus Woesearchaeota archaeon CG1_02_47_18]PIO04092.1 MAG: 50S ribosomal protein L14 [Candidatus Woesearchaeota archaeon CG08_land_8_20_14_0_20_47_9]HII29783.1 50S ribosomal protein L14 [Candidatus Woesearchaeota archaeon]
MKAVKARISKGLCHRSVVATCDNSGAKLLRIVSVVGSKTVHGRKPSCGIGDLILASVIKGSPEMRKQVVYAVIVRQKKEYRRLSGIRVGFEDNAAVVLKDDKGNPKGTLFKGAIAKEAADRWPAISKVGAIIL